MLHNLPWVFTFCLQKCKHLLNTDYFESHKTTNSISRGNVQQNTPVIKIKNIARGGESICTSRDEIQKA